jgi:hypothetical protein
MLGNHQHIMLDEPVPPPYQFNFGETVNEPIHIFTTPTVTDIQFDHISAVRRFKYDTIEEALRNRHSNKHKGPYLGY